MAQPNIINIQKYSIHDGDGIRTTIFFKGCALSCEWCHNPESQRFCAQPMVYSERCRACGACEQVCPAHCIHVDEGGMKTDFARCIACRSCVDRCVQNARAVIGDHYTVPQLVKIVEQDKMFYETSGGGVTLSGGETLLQDMDYIEELMRKLYRKGYSVAVDTCGYAPWENFERILPYTDFFLYDVKAIDPKLHKRYTGQDNQLILSNLKKLSDAGARIYIRIPVVEEVNANEQEMDAIVLWLKENINVERVALLPYHNTGMDKYERLGEAYHGASFHRPSEQRMQELAKKFRVQGCFNQVQIGG